MLEGSDQLAPIHTKGAPSLDNTKIYEFAADVIIIEYAQMFFAQIINLKKLLISQIEPSHCSKRLLEENIDTKNL